MHKIHIEYLYTLITSMYDSALRMVGNDAILYKWLYDHEPAL